jgi:hypothetical protein
MNSKQNNELKTDIVPLPVYYCSPKNLNCFYNLMINQEKNWNKSPEIIVLQNPILRYGYLRANIANFEFCKYQKQNYQIIIVSGKLFKFGAILASFVYVASPESLASLGRVG